MVALKHLTLNNIRTLRPAKFPDVALFSPLVGIHFEKFNIE